MIKRIIDVSRARTYISVSLGQLIIKQEGQEAGRIPCEDVGVLLVHHSGTTYTHSVFTELLRCGAAIVLCSANHHPSGMFLPIESNSVQTERYRQQINAKEPVKKRLWKQIVKAKIEHQAKLVNAEPTVARALLAMRDQVRSGDPNNIEAQSSKKFWCAYLPGQDFHRDTKGIPPNNLLNYGYMVMRAAIARALCSAGLLPCLGIHHRNRYNAFCLADDMLEPFRGFVESRVRDIWTGSAVPVILDQVVKAKLLEVLYGPVIIAGFKGPLMVGLHRTMASLQRCFAGDENKVDLPVL